MEDLVIHVKSKDIRLGIVCPIYLPKYGGGPRHAYEVLSRLIRVFNDISLLPSSDTFLILNDEGDKEQVLKVADQYRKLGFEVPEVFDDLLGKFRIMSYVEKARNAITLGFNKKLSNEYSRINKKLDILFDPIFGDLDIIMLSRKLSNGKYGFTHQSNLTSRYLIGRLWKYLRYSWSAISLYGLAIQVPPSIMNIHMKRLMRIYGKPRFVALLSKGQAEALSIDDWGVPYFILNPANAVDPELLNHRDVRKDDYLVFYARMHPEKGIFELPKIIKVLRDEYDEDVKLKVMGAFPNDGVRRVFFSLVRRYGVENNIEYLGFVNEEEKHEIVAKAKVLIYPSHSDWFSLVILESLALGTPVVAYDIPGPKSVFGDLPGVLFVREFDVRGLALAVVRILDNYDHYLGPMYGEKLLSFIRLHTSWDLVARQVINLIKESVAG